MREWGSEGVRELESSVVSGQRVSSWSWRKEILIPLSNSNSELQLIPETRDPRPETRENMI